MKLRKMRKKACHYCCGQGWVQDSYDDMFGHVGSYEQICEDCDGKGYVLTQKKHCIDCGDKFYGEELVQRCDECNHVHILKSHETSLQDDNWGMIP